MGQLGSYAGEQGQQSKGEEAAGQQQGVSWGGTQGLETGKAAWKQEKAMCLARDTGQALNTEHPRRTPGLPSGP